MKSLIKKILLESSDEKIINLLKSKFNYDDVKGIIKYLDSLGYSEKEITKLISVWFKMETGVELTPLNWMNQNFSPNQLEIVKSKDYPNSIFFRKNGKVVMEQNKKSRYFYFDYDDIWSFFELFFGIKYQQIHEVLRHWLEETLKLEGYTPEDMYGLKDEWLEETLKLEGYTPGYDNYMVSLMLDETLKLE